MLFSNLTTSLAPFLISLDNHLFHLVIFDLRQHHCCMWGICDTTVPGVIMLTIKKFE